MRKVLIVTNYFFPGKKGGGPISSIKNLVAESKLFDTNVEFEILTSGKDYGDKELYTDISFNTNVLYKEIPSTYLSSNFNILPYLFRNRSFDTLHLNSLFNFWYSIIFIFFLKLKFIKADKIIISPRGELSEAAMNYKFTKKILFLKLVNFLNLYEKVVWHVTSTEEHNDVTRNFETQQTYVYHIDNCVSPNKDLLTKYKKSNSVKIVFLSRIHPKKNLMYALSVVSQINFPYTFDIYGPIEDKSYFDKCFSYIKSFQGDSVIKYRGEVNNDDVSEVLSNYDLFFFPTEGENFGHVSFEALMAGTPVLISNRTPLTGLADLNIGWDLDLSEPSEFAKKIRVIYKMDQKEMLSMQNSIESFIKNSKFFRSKFPQYEEMYLD